MIRCKFKIDNCRFVCTPLILLLFVVELICVCRASEFPDRECCDPIHPGFNQSTLPPTTASISPSSSPIPIGQTGEPYIKYHNYIYELKQTAVYIYVYCIYTTEKQ